MSPRGRLVFAGVCLLAFASIAAWLVSSPWRSPSGGSHAPGTPAAGATRPGGPAVVDLHDAGELQARFNADKGAPRLLLALSPT
jgi:hypothetical protein